MPIMPTYRSTASGITGAEAGPLHGRRLAGEMPGRGLTVGGVVEILVRGCPPGWGEPVFDKLEADLAGALMSIGAIRGVEVGAGFEVACMLGSQCNDSLGP